MGQKDKKDYNIDDIGDEKARVSDITIDINGAVTTRTFQDNFRKICETLEEKEVYDKDEFIELIRGIDPQILKDISDIKDVSNKDYSEMIDLYFEQDDDGRYVVVSFENGVSDCLHPLPEIETPTGRIEYDTQDPNHTLFMKELHTLVAENLKLDDYKYLELVPAKGSVLDYRYGVNMFFMLENNEGDRAVVPMLITKSADQMYTKDKSEMRKASNGLSTTVKNGKVIVHALVANSEDYRKALGEIIAEQFKSQVDFAEDPEGTFPDKILQGCRNNFRARLSN